MQRILGFQSVLSQFLRCRWASLLSYGLIVVLCWSLAQWTWLVLTPKARRTSVELTLFSVKSPVDTISVSHLFGRASVSGEVIEKTAATFSNLKLRGVFSARGSLPAFAILSVDGKPDQPVKMGMEIGPGLLLVAVHPDRVEVRRNGASEWLELDMKAAGSNGVAMDADFRLNVQSRSPGNFSFSRSELHHALQDPKQMKNLGKLATRAGWNALIVDAAPRGSLAEKLGLQQNDVVTHLNGQAMASNEDIGRFYQQLNTVGQAKLVGLRGGKPLMLTYSIQ